MYDWDDFDSIEDVCSYCNATFRGDMLRDHIILEHCHESEKEHNYKVILAEHSLKSLYHVQEEEVQTEKQLRSRKVEGVVGSKNAKKRTLKDWSQQHQSLLIKMNESIIDDDDDKDEPSSTEPSPKRRSIGDDNQQIEIQGNIITAVKNESVSNPVATPEPISEKMVENHNEDNQESVPTVVRRSQRNRKP